MTMLEPGVVCIRKPGAGRVYRVFRGDVLIGEVYPSVDGRWFADASIGEIVGEPPRTRRAAIAQLVERVEAVEAART